MGLTHQCFTGTWPLTGEFLWWWPMDRLAGTCTLTVACFFALRCVGDVDSGKSIMGVFAKNNILWIIHVYHINIYISHNMYIISYAYICIRVDFKRPRIGSLRYICRYENNTNRITCINTFNAVRFVRQFLLNPFNNLFHIFYNSWRLLSWLTMLMSLKRS